jgi:hypothetical protein
MPEPNPQPVRRFLGTPVADYLPALGLVVVTIVYLAIAAGYKPLVRAFPAGVAWIMLGLLALDLASRTGTRAGRALTRWLNPAAADAPPAQPLSRQIAAALWLAGFATLLVLVGVLVAVPLYMFAALRWRGRRSLAACLTAAAGATLFVWLMFAELLRLSLYPGLLFGGA